MFACKSCGSIFNFPSDHKGKSVCPDCGGKSICEVNQCEICRSYFARDNYYDRYCPDCVKAAEDQFRSAVEKWVDADFIKLLRHEWNDLDSIMEGEDA